MKTSFVIVMGVIVAGAAVVAWNAARAERLTEAALAAGAQREARVYAQIQRAEQRLAAAESEEANVRSFLAGRQKTKTSETVVPPARPNPPATSVEALAEKLSLSPERTMAQMRRLAQQRKNIAFEHLPLIARLNLSPAQAEKLIAINLRRFEDGMDIPWLIKQGRVAPDDPILREWRARSIAERDAACRELLGEAGFEQWREYNRSAIARGFVADFAAIALLAGTPFTAPQLEQLVPVVANGCSDYRSGKPVNWRLNTFDWDMVDAQVRPLMSESQWNLFTTVASHPGWDRSSSRVQGAMAKALHAEAAAGATQAADFK